MDAETLESRVLIYEISKRQICLKISSLSKFHNPLMLPLVSMKFLHEIKIGKKQLISNTQMAKVFGAIWKFYYWDSPYGENQ